MSRERGILGLKKDPKHQLLFLFKVPEGEEWPSSDSDDEDYRPEKHSRGISESDDSDVSVGESATVKRKTAKSSHDKLNANNNAGTSRGHKSVKRKHGKTQKDKLPSSKKPKLSTTKSVVKDGFPHNKHEETLRQKDGEGRKVQVTSSAAVDVSSLPPELWMKIFQFVVDSIGPLPFLCRASKVCQMWRELATHPSLWQRVDLSFGWIKTTDQTLDWLARHRLSQCREISLSGWKNVTNNAVKELAEHCPQLESVNLSHCSKLTSVAVGALVDSCRSLRELDLSFISMSNLRRTTCKSDGVSVQSLKKVAEGLGRNLTCLNVAGNNLKGFHLALNAIMENCPNLETLDISNAKFSTDFLMLHVEKMHISCPALRIFRLANCKVRGSNVSQRAQEESPGFTELRQLSCAMPGNDSPMTGGGVPDNLLQRLMHKAPHLKLLDLRGCTSFHPDTLLASPADSLSQLYLSMSSITRYSEALETIALKWGHSLKELDLAWNIPAPEHLASAVKALTGMGTCPLEHVNLAGTTALLPSVTSLLMKLPNLKSLDLTSCRALPRGIKCLHEGRKALSKLRKTINI